MATAAIVPPDGFVLDNPSPPDGFVLDSQTQPDMGAANKTFARIVGDALGKAADTLKPTEQTLGDIGQVYPAVEAALNAGTGLLFGFPAYIGGAIGGLAEKYALGMNVDPKEMAETMSKVFTYQPLSQAGARLSGNVMYPLAKLQEGSEWAGHRVTDISMAAGASDNFAAAAGAVTEATLQMLPIPLLGELNRKMSGQRITSEDMSNTAKVIAGDDATPATVQVVENSLHATYDKTGIGPYTVLEEAHKNPEIKADLLDPNVEVPGALADYQEKMQEPDAPVPGDGAPLLDVSGRSEQPTLNTVAEIMSSLRQVAGSDQAKAAVSEFVNKPLFNSDSGITATVSNATIRKMMSESSVSNSVSSEAHMMAIANLDSLFPIALYRESRASIKQPETVSAMHHFDVPMMYGDQLLHVKILAKEFAKQQHGTRLYDIKAVEIGEPASSEGVIASPELPTSLKSVSPAGSGDRFRQLVDKVKQGEEFPTANGSDTVDLNSGINLRSVLKNYVDDYTPYVGIDHAHGDVAVPTVGLKTPEYSPSPLGDSLRKIFAPATRGALAEQQAGIMRANFGEMAHEREVALENLKPIAASFDKMPVEYNIKFIDAMEHGETSDEALHLDPEMNDAARHLRALLDAKREEVQALGKGNLENFDENYFPHIWKDHDEAQALFSRRPLEGSKSFLKQRTIPYTTDGLRWRAYDAEGDFLKSFNTEAEAKAAMPDGGRVGEPLTPITTNPVELAMLKAREMDKYIYGQRIFSEMKGADMARFVAFGKRALPGWTKINDKIARVLQPNEGEGGGMILRGEYYAPDEAATLINNHLSPGLQGNSFYDAWRGIGMALNSAQLGLSFFHVGFTTMDSMVSKVALGVKQIARGDIVDGSMNVAQGLNPVQPFVNIYKGDRLLRAYLGKLDSPEMAPIVDAIQQAGGRVKMDDFYRNETVNAFKQALRNNDKMGAVKSFLPTVLDRISAPIFEELVPRQKLGVFFDMAKDWIEKNPDATAEQKRADLGKLWDSVDNRMGQLVYDNVFWNRALKDGLMATVRSVGWNLGTFRELGGGVLDIKDIAQNKAISDRTAYVIALPLVAAIYGAITYYTYTGKRPETLKDCFYPKTGRIRPDGLEDRVSLPTYMKDVFAYGEDATNFAKYGSDPTQTIKNKAHPLISVVSQMLNNQDFFGAAIRNPADPAVRQIEDEAKYLITQFEPFSLRNYQQQAKTQREEPTVAGYVTSPSMIGITPAPGYITKSPEEQESAQVSRLRDSLMKKFKEEIKDGADVENLIPQMIGSGLSRQDIRYVISSSGETTRQHRIKSFSDYELGDN